MLKFSPLTCTPLPNLRAADVFATVVFPDVLPRAEFDVMAIAPALIIVLPVKVLTPPKVRVPVPFLVSPRAPPPVPSWIVPLKVLLRLSEFPTVSTAAFELLF